ncbi:MAG: DUF4878 domain-containing protein [Lentisphaeria bacterium]|nr:DUF4878 domain-containing protein [Lentisphaeria bacterium]
MENRQVILFLIKAEKKLKKLILAIAAVFCTVFVAGCSDSPTEVTEKWHKALLDGDVNKANEYSTSNVHFLNAMIVGMLKENEDKEKAKEMRRNMENTKFIKEEIDGDNAKVWQEGQKEPVTLKKVDGDWKVDVKK